MKRYCLLMAVVTLAAASVPASAETDRLQARQLPASISGLKLDQPLSTYATNPALDRNLASAFGVRAVDPNRSRSVIIRMTGPNFDPG